MNHPYKGIYATMTSPDKKAVRHPLTRRHTTLPSLYFILMLFISSNATDTLVSISGEEKYVTILKILPETIEFRTAENPDGPLYVVKKSEQREIRFANGTRESFSKTQQSVTAPAQRPEKKYLSSLEIPLGVFGLFNVENKFTPAIVTFGAVPSFVVRYHKHLATGLECMLLWGQVDSTDDPPRFIINANIRNEVLFPLTPDFTLNLITSGGMSIWPVHDTLGQLDSTFFHQRTGWNLRVAFGLDWQMSENFSLLCNLGYSASSSASNDIWITHDMMTIIAGIRYSFDLKKADSSVPGN